MFSGWHDVGKRICKWDDPDCFSVTTPQWPWEIGTLAKMFQEKHCMKAVEIGTFHGGTLRIWLAHAHPGAHIVAIDPEPKLDGLMPREGIKVDVLTNRSDNPAVIEHVKAIAPIDFLFIDGDHEYDGVHYDFETYGPMVARGGMIAFHDIGTYRQDCGVPRLWDEIRHAGYVTMELYAPHMPQIGLSGGGIGVVFV